MLRDATAALMSINTHTQRVSTVRTQDPLPISPKDKPMRSAISDWFPGMAAFACVLVVFVASILEAPGDAAPKVEVHAPAVAHG